MFIRVKEKQNKNSNKVYYTHELVQSVRTENGPRQKKLLSLDPFDLDQKYLKQLAKRIEGLLNGQQLLVSLEDHVEILAQHYKKLLVHKQIVEHNEPMEFEQDYQMVDLNAVSSHEGQSVGPEHVGVQAMKQLGFFKLFRKLKFTKQTMDLATLLIVGRLVHPSSERELKRYAEEGSGLDDILQTDFSRLTNHALYDTSDIDCDNLKLISL